MPEFDIFNVWWGRLGLAGVLGYLLFLLVKWVGRRMTAQEKRIQAQIDARAEEDRQERIRLAEEARREREALAKRLRDTEDARVKELKDTTMVVVKALTDCTVAQQGNDRSRRRLDVTLRDMNYTLRNLACNRGAAMPSASEARTFQSPLPSDEETPTVGEETQHETDAIIRADRPADERLRPDQQRRPGAGPHAGGDGRH